MENLLARFRGFSPENGQAVMADFLNEFLRNGESPVEIEREEPRAMLHIKKIEMDTQVSNAFFIVR